MDNNNLGPSSLKSFDRRLPSVRGTIVEDPKDPLGGTVWFLIHHIMDKVVKEDNPGFGLTAPEQFRSANVPSSHVIQCALPLIFEFHSLPFRRSRSKGLMSSMSGLNAGFFIGGEDIFIGSQGEPTPRPLIQIQNQTGFLLKVRVPGKNPTAVLPRLDRIFIKPSPDGGTTYVGNDSPLNGLFRNLPSAESRQGNPFLTGQFASQGLDLNHHVRGKSRTGVRAWIDLPALQFVHRKTSSATYLQSGEAGSTFVQWYRCRYPVLSLIGRR